MYDKEKVEEIMEFCHDISTFYEKNTKNHRNQSTQSTFFMDSSSDKKEIILPTAEARKETRFLKEIISFFLCLLIAYGAARLITDFLVQPTRVEGASMETALFDGDMLLIDKISYRLRDPERFDVIIFPYSMNTYYVKRIIGLPGETIQIKDGFIYINDEKLSEQYGNEKIEMPGIVEYPLLLANDEYFLMGDNRNHSTDSRSIFVGPVKKNKLEGKVWLRLYPFNKVCRFR